jgi:hypothetical protein
MFSCNIAKIAQSVYWLNYRQGSQGIRVHFLAGAGDIAFQEISPLFNNLLLIST